MEFKVIELEREPIEFALELAPGAVDLGEEAEQVGPLATAGVAEVLHEHRGPKDIVADIRLKGNFSGTFQVPCARCVSRCFCPCRSEPCASLIAKGFARAAVRTATAPRVPAKWVRKTPAGKRWLGSAAGSSPQTNPKRLRVLKPNSAASQRIAKSRRPGAGRQLMRAFNTKGICHA